MRNAVTALIAGIAALNSAITTRGEHRSAYDSADVPSLSLSDSSSDEDRSGELPGKASVVNLNTSRQSDLFDGLDCYASAVCHSLEVTSAGVHGHDAAGDERDAGRIGLGTEPSGSMRLTAKDS